MTLSGLLNALDGVGAPEGRIIIATTNKYHVLDPALIRPGRMDVHLEFKNASKYQAGKLFTRFYLPQAVEKEVDSLPVAVAPGPAMLSLYASDMDALTEKPSCMDNFQPDEKAIQELAIQFSRAIPEYEFSMASLQGYLLLYKTRPLDAVQDVAKWVNSTCKIQTARENMTISGNTSTSTPPLTPASPPVHLTKDNGATGA